MSSLFYRLARLFLVVIIMAAAPSQALSQDTVTAPFQNKIVTETKALDDVGRALAALKDGDDTTQQTLQALRLRVEQTQTDLAGLIASIAPIRNASNERLDKLRNTQQSQADRDALADEKLLNTRLGTIIAAAQTQSARAKDYAAAINQRLQLSTAGGLGFSAADFQNRLNRATSSLERIKADLANINIADDSAQLILPKLRISLEETRTDMLALQNDLVPAREISKKRLTALGDPPVKGEPAEAPDVKETRDRETALSKSLDDVAKNLQYQLTKSTELINSLTELQREAIAGHIFRSGDGFLSSRFWIRSAANFPQALSAAGYVANTSFIYFRSQLTSTSIAIFFLTIAVGYILTHFMRLRITEWRKLLLGQRTVSRRYVASLDACLGFIHAMFGLPAALFTGLQAFSFSGLVQPYIIEDFGRDFVRAGIAGTLLWALSRAILSVQRPELRLIPLSDWAVRRISRRMTLFAVVLGISTLLDGFIRSLHADPSLTIARDGISALFYIIIISSLLIRIRAAPPTIVDGRVLSIDEDITRLDMLRPLSWLSVAVMAVSLLLGYMTLAVMAVILPLMILSIVAASYILMTLVDSALTDNLLNDHERRRKIAAAIGVTTKRVAFSATLMSGVLRFIIFLLALLALMAPFGLYSIEMLPALKRAYFSFQIGEMTISPSTILIGLILFISILAVTRLIRNWVHNTLLPSTTLDAGLQNSIATIIGYIGMIIAVLALAAELGLSFQNVSTIIAALGIGIGLGLQPIVTNFVSGLILLAERPIRVGDIVAASGEEGYVRRISVRATQIETFDRATLIVPNSMLINSAVKNWYYGNTWSRLRITLALGYDCDVDEVRTAMLSAAMNDSRVLSTPSPKVLLSQMGSSALDFELTAVVANLESVPAVRSDILLHILRIFREKGIKVAGQIPPAPEPETDHSGAK